MRRQCSRASGHLQHCHLQHSVDVCWSSSAQLLHAAAHWHCTAQVGCCIGTTLQALTNEHALGVSAAVYQTLSSMASKTYGAKLTAWRLRGTEPNKARCRTKSWFIMSQACWIQAAHDGGPMERLTVMR